MGPPPGGAGPHPKSPAEDPQNPGGWAGPGHRKPPAAPRLRPPPPPPPPARAKPYRHVCAVRAVARAQTPGVIYLGHIPHGFYEKQMKSFFGQFGEVSKLRLSRNKKTGRSRHYAFIEFADRHVATVVAETMDKYLLCNKLLVCKVVDAEKLHERVWVGANKKFQQVPWRSIARNQHNGRRTAQQQQQRQGNLVRKETKKRKKLAELGIDYDFGGYKELLPKKAQKTQF